MMKTSKQELIRNWTTNFNHNQVKIIDVTVYVGVYASHHGATFFLWWLQIVK